MSYKWIFISTYKYYARYRDRSPRFAATVVVSMGQFFLFFLLFVALKRIGFDVFRYIPNNYYVIPVMPIWILLVNRIYSEEKIERLLVEFNSFPDHTRKFWAVVSVCAYAAPLILSMLLLVK